jgi:DNA-binding NarL/FixJ family response regulator
LIAALGEAAPNSRVVVVSGESDARVVHAALEAGAVGFVPKTSTPRGMVDALRVAAAGGVSLPDTTVPADLDFDAAAEPASHAGMPLRAIAEAFPMLTPRQQQVLAALARGLSNKAIARELDAAEGTIKQHAHAIYQALGVDSRTEALYVLARRGVRLI